MLCDECAFEGHIFEGNCCVVLVSLEGGGSELTFGIEQLIIRPTVLYNYFFFKYLDCSVQLTQAHSINFYILLIICDVHNEDLMF